MGGCLLMPLKSNGMEMNVQLFLVQANALAVRTLGRDLPLLVREAITLMKDCSCVHEGICFELKACPQNGSGMVMMLKMDELRTMDR